MFVSEVQTFELLDIVWCNLHCAPLLYSVTIYNLFFSEAEMKYFEILKDSMIFPKKNAVLKLNKVEMKHTLVYLFILMAIFLLPVEWDMLYHTTEKNEGYYIQVLMLFPIFTIFLSLIGITFIAGCVKVVSKQLSRELKYQLLWKMTIFAITKPMITALLIQFIFGSDSPVMFLAFALLVVNFIRMVLVFPKRKSR